MADTLAMPTSDASYEVDFYAWTQRQAQHLRDAAQARVNAPIDWENVAEEIESVGRSDRREVESLTGHILLHLIKMAASPSDNPRNGWQREIRSAREKLERLLRASPSLRTQLPEIVNAEWPQALESAHEDLDDFGESHLAAETLDALQRRGPSPNDVTQRGFYPSRGQV